MIEDSVILSILASCELEDFVHLPCAHIEIDERHRRIPTSTETNESEKENHRKKLAELRRRAENLKRMLKEDIEGNEER